MSNESRLTFLLTRIVNGTAEPEECEELKRLLNDESGNNIRAANDFFNAYESDEDHEMKTPPIFWQHAVKQILAVDKEADATLLTPVPVHRVHFLKTAWFRYAAAILIVLGIGAYLRITQQKDKPQITTTKPVPLKNDVLPGSDRATLTLSNGQHVQLNHSASETIKDGNLSIENEKGQLSYKNAEVVAINTMTTPKGGQYQLTLEDGTKVWLNAASSITYPTAFKESTREVSVTGEAYFEVMKNPSKPFVVKTPKEEITVLGTHFNVNAYSDEPAMKISLLEGSVKIAEKILKPGQAYQQGKVIPTHVAQDVAWKNGLFDLNGRDFATAMRQIERWYDISVKYEGKVPEKDIRGKMGRDLTLSQVLKVLEKLEVTFRMEGRTLIVSP